MDTAPASLAAGGLAIGFLFGALAERTNFCAMGAISDYSNFRDARRARAWALAAAVAILGTQGLAAAGIVDLGKSIYLAPRLNWAGHLVGGTIFGFGMVLAGGCASRNLIRAGAGDLRALVTLLVVGLFALMAGGGLLGPLRIALADWTAIEIAAPTQSLSDIAGTMPLVAAARPGLIFPLAAAGFLLAWAFWCARFRASPMHWLSGLGAGLLVAAAWGLTGLAFDEMAYRVQPPVSLSFVKPTADTFEWFERYTGQGLPAFGVATVLGVALGSFASALLRGRLHLAGFAGASDTARNLAGAAMMGAGGVMALGCTVGQGLAGLSTLAAGSALSAAAIIFGAVLGLKALERWMA